MIKRRRSRESLGDDWTRELREFQELSGSNPSGATEAALHLAGSDDPEKRRLIAIGLPDLHRTLPYEASYLWVQLLLDDNRSVAGNAAASLELAEISGDVDTDAAMGIVQRVRSIRLAQDL